MSELPRYRKNLIFVVLVVVCCGENNNYDITGAHRFFLCTSALLLAKKSTYK